MSLYYKPNRKPDYNYGGPRWRLSRSKVGLFMECQRCFYTDNKLGVARPPGFPFNLNSAVDALLKKEFDALRESGQKHALHEEYGVDAVPFKHKDLDVWRENFKGVEYRHPATGMLVCGAVDDIWVNGKGELIVVDYKSTSKDKRIDSLDEEWHDGYKRQMEFYQWLLRRNGFEVSNTGYWVYANATKERDGFDAKLEFEMTLIPHEGSDTWVEPTLLALKECLDSEEIPMPTADCDYCRYREAAGKALLAQASKNKEGSAKRLPDIPAPAPIKSKKIAYEENTGTLF